MTMRLAIRAFRRRAVLWEKRLDIDSSDEAVLGVLGEQHAREMARGLYNMIEMEFLDEPDPLNRYFRFGLNPEGMVAPIALDLTR